MIRLLIATLLCLAFASPAPAGHCYVDWTGVGADYDNIADGISWAAPTGGDTVLVRPGVYDGPSNTGLDFGGKDLTLLSTHGPDVTTIDGGGTARVMTIGNGETAAARVSGFTIANGMSAMAGGLWIYEASPTIENCRFVNCVATGANWGGGGVSCSATSANPVFRDVEFSGCTGDYGAGFMSFNEASPTLDRVRFLGNTALYRGGGAYIELPAGAVTFTDCTFYNNTVTNGAFGCGGGLALLTASPIITGTTFAWNSAIYGGCIGLMNSSSPTIENCILAFSQGGNALYPLSGTNIPVTTQSCIYGNADGDSLIGTHSNCSFDDPLFCDVLTGDMHLCGNSPCEPGFNPWGLVGAYEVGCTDCLAPAELRSWTAIKALYR